MKLMVAKIMLIAVTFKHFSNAIQTDSDYRKALAKREVSYTVYLFILLLISYQQNDNTVALFSQSFDQKWLWPITNEMVQFFTCHKICGKNKQHTYGISAYFCRYENDLFDTAV